VPPIDEAIKDRSLLMERKKLLEALKHHDKSALLKEMDPKIGYALGGGAGVRDFCENWQLNRQDSSFWAKLTYALEHGGYFEHENGNLEFNAPYCRFYFPEDKIQEDSSRAIVVEKNVPLHATPGRLSKVVAILSYDLLQVPEEQGTKWTKVITTSGASGYIETKYLRFDSDDFAVLRKSHGKWRLVWFGAASR
jgi:hypothetical protein